MSAQSSPRKSRPHVSSKAPEVLPGRDKIATDGRVCEVPLAALEHSPLNVRKTRPAEIDALAALIAAQGLLERLVVVRQDAASGRKRSRSEARFEVVAGGRRFAALCLLRDQGTLTPDALIPCLEVDRARAVILSLTENSGREALSVIDECQAFRTLVDAGRSIEDIAAAFHVSALTVRRRLKLATLSPKLLELHREGAIHVEQLMALALTEDHRRQEQVWESLPSWQRQAHDIRRVLTESAIDATSDPVARFVGLAAYEAAGGVVRRDLFSLDGEGGLIEDAVLLERLARERLEAAAEEVRAEGWAWVETIPRAGYSVRGQFRRCATHLREATTEEASRIEALETELGEANARYENLDEGDTDPPEADTLYETCTRLEEELADLQGQREVFDPADQAIAGAIVTIDRDGSVEVIRGLVRPQDEPDTLQRDSAGATDGTPDSAPSERKAELSQALVRRLTAHRTAALRIVLARQPMVALVVLAHRLAGPVLYTRYGSGGRLGLRLDIPNLGAAAPDLEEHRAAPAWEAACEGWRKRLPEDYDALLTWLFEQEPSVVINLTALCVSAGIDLVSERLSEDAWATTVASATKLDMREWWTVSAMGYLRCVSKPSIIEAMREIGVSEIRLGALVKMPKDELVIRAEEELSKARWIPMMLQ